MTYDDSGPSKPRAFLSSPGNFAWTLFLLALAVRLAYVLPLPLDRLSYDAYGWMNTASDVLQGRGVGGSVRAPGYIFLLAGIFSIFGRSVVAVRVIQALIGALTCVVVYGTAKKAFSEVTGRIAGVLVCFYPYFIAYTGDVLCETLLTFMLVLITDRIFRTAETPSRKQFALTGFLMGLTALTKSVALPFFMLACVWLWWRTGKLRLTALTAVFMVLTIAPWTMRNYFHYDKSYFMPVSSPWYSVYASYSDEAPLNETIGDRLKGPGIAPIEQFVPKDEPYVQSLTGPERDKYCKEKVFAWIKANPGKVPWLIYKRFLHFWRLYPMIAYKWEKAAAIATSGLYIPLAAAGIFLSLALLRNTSLLLALLASYTAVHILLTTCLRYRVPIDTFVIMFAAYTLERAYAALKNRPRNSRAP